MKFSFDNLSLRHIGYGISLIASLLVIIVAWYSFLNLPDCNWSTKQLWWGIPAFFLYPISLGIMLLDWVEVMHSIGLTMDKASNLYLYCINFITRRLPMGLLWSAGSRIALYSEVGINAKKLSPVMFWEFLLHSLSAFLVWFVLELVGVGFVEHLPITLGSHLWLIGGLVVLGSGILLYIYMPQLRKHRQADGMSPTGFLLLGKIVLLYTLTWINAGVMLWLVSRIIVKSPLTIGRIVAIWSFVGSIGGVLSLLPFNIGAKEVSLALLLSQFTSLPQATLITVMFRLLLTLSDIIWPMSFALGLRGFVKRDIFTGRQTDQSRHLASRQ